MTKTVNSLEVLENQAVFSLSNIPDRPGIAAQIFEKLSEASINVDLIIQATNDGNNNDITFTVSELEIKKTSEQCEHITSQLGGEFNLKTNLTKLSIQGAGIMGLSLIHISEPTRLLAISYAVFCLKVKSNLSL